MMEWGITVWGCGEREGLLRIGENKKDIMHHMDSLLGATCDLVPC